MAPPPAVPPVGPVPMESGDGVPRARQYSRRNFSVYFASGAWPKGVYHCSTAAARPKRAVVRSDATDIRSYLKLIVTEQSLLFDSCE